MINNKTATFLVTPVSDPALERENPRPSIDKAKIDERRIDLAITGINICLLNFNRCNKFPFVLQPFIT